MSLRGRMGLFVPDESEEAQARRKEAAKLRRNDELISDVSREKDELEDQLLDKIDRERSGEPRDASEVEETSVGAKLAVEDDEPEAVQVLDLTNHAEIETSERATSFANDEVLPKQIGLKKDAWLRPNAEEERAVKWTKADKIHKTRSDEKSHSYLRRVSKKTRRDT